MKYAVIFERTRTGWSAFPPDIPGVGVAGKTLEETRKLISEAMALHLSWLRKDGDPVPEPTSHAEDVELASDESLLQLEPQLRRTRKATTA